MPVTIKGSGGGSVTLDASTAAADTTLTLPNTSGTILQSGTAVTAAQGGTGLTSPGAAGNVLTSNGTGWTSSALSLTPGVNVQTFTSSGTWTKPAGYAAGSRVLIQAWGGGGGGGRGNSFGGGGGGGGYNERWLTLSQLGATETITVGAGGAARTTDGAGNDGGNTTAGSWVTAYGGGGGSGSGGGGGGQLSAGSNGNIAATAGKPWFYMATDGAGNNAYVGNGANTAIPGPYPTGYGYDAFVHGAGGGANNGAYNGGNSVWGGGGGGGRPTGTGGSSSFAGAGGAAGISGTTPAGGGGGVVGANSGAGGAGQVIITVFPA